MSGTRTTDPFSGESLGDLTDRLTAALDDAEDALDDLRLGVSASAPLGVDQQLVWTKRGSEWGLFVVSTDGAFHDVGTTSRAVRIMAAAALPVLYEALVEAQEGTRGDVIEAIEATRAFVEGLRAKTRAA